MSHSTGERDAAQAGVAGGSSSGGSPTTTRVAGTALRAVIDHGVIVGLVVAFAVFSALRPETFFTLTNVKTMLQQMAPLAIAAFGLTVVLIMNDFDLSLGAMIGLGGTTAIVLMSKSGVDPVFAIAGALALAVLVGVANGVAIAFAGASSFVITLAMSTILVGVEDQITNQQSVFENVPQSYTHIANGTVFGVSNQVVFCLAVLVILLVVLELTVTGRRMYAIGANPDAAELSGIRVRELRLLGFVLAAVCSTVAGLLLTSQAGQSTPELGTSYLLPAFAAAFLGATALRGGRFNVVGTFIGAAFLQVIATGLVFLSLSSAYINIVQGVILASAVLLARLERQRA